MFGILPRLTTGRGRAGLGIDLGTQNTLVHRTGEGIVVDEPSVMALHERSGELVALGTEARRMVGKTHSDVTSIQPISGGVITNPNHAELLLRGFMEQAIRDRYFRLKPAVVVGIPSGIKEIELRAIRTSAYAAGARDVRMVYEPMAAAIGCGLPVDAPRGSMILDIGGGTSEIAVISLSGIVSEASIQSAGDVIDEALVTAVRRDLKLEVGRPTAERMKRTIGSALPLEDEIEMDIAGRDMAEGTPRRISVSSTEVREWIQEPIGQILRAVRSALERTPPELAADIHDYGITLTGGGAYIRRLDERITQATGVPVQVDGEPLTAVARGTAQILEDPRTYESVLMA